MRNNCHHSPGGGLTPTVWAIRDVPLFGGSFLSGLRCLRPIFVRTEIFGVDFLKISENWGRFSKLRFLGYNYYTCDKFQFFPCFIFGTDTLRFLG